MNPPSRQPGRPLVAVGADDVHLDFARRVAAEPRAVLHQNDSRAVSRRGDRRANTRQAAAGDKDVSVEVHLSHVGFRAGACSPGSVRRHQGIHLAPDLFCDINALRSGLGGSGAGEDGQRVKEVAALHAEI